MQLKEYQSARKKLEQRRLAYDTSLAKVQKAKREDFRVEEELRSQKAKYEESEDDVYRRMQDIKEGESESITDLTAFLDAELAYHEKCREALLQLRNEWPAKQNVSRSARPGPRSRSNTLRTYTDRSEPEEATMAEPRPAIRSNRSTSYRQDSSAVDYGEMYVKRPSFTRNATMDSAASSRRDISPMAPPRPARMPSDSLTLRTTRTQLRNVDQTIDEQDVFRDDSTFYTNSSPDHAYSNRSVSPATSQDSSAALPTSVSSVKKGPPPPPPAKKRAPPPPPMKRTVLA